MQGLTSNPSLIRGYFDGSFKSGNRAGAGIAVYGAFFDSTEINKIVDEPAWFLMVTAGSTIVAVNSLETECIACKEVTKCILSILYAKGVNFAKDCRVII